MANKRFKNRVVGYVKPTYIILFENYCKVNKLSESKAVGIAIKTLFDSMPNDIRVKYSFKSSTQNESGS